MSEQALIKEELEILEDLYPGGLEKVLKAIHGGQIQGSSYDFCVLGHVLPEDFSLMKKNATASDLVVEIYGEDEEEEEERIYLEIEHLVMAVKLGETSENNVALATLEKCIHEVLR